MLAGATLTAPLVTVPIVDTASGPIAGLPSAHGGAAHIGVPYATALR